MMAYSQARIAIACLTGHFCGPRAANAVGRGILRGVGGRLSRTVIKYRYPHFAATIESLHTRICYEVSLLCLGVRHFLFSTYM
jgi:hypothetical protein